MEQYLLGIPFLERLDSLGTWHCLHAVKEMVPYTMLLTRLVRALPGGVRTRGRARIEGGNEMNSEPASLAGPIYIGSSAA